MIGMSLRLALVTLIAGLAASSALAAAPVMRTLSAAHGSGSVTVRANTAHLRSRLWFARRGGAGIARGQAGLSCHQSGDPTGVHEDIAIDFTLAPDSRRLIWRSSKGSCAVTVSLKGQGVLRVALVGY
jgi:hypothetical protein